MVHLSDLQSKGSMLALPEDTLRPMLSNAPPRHINNIIIFHFSELNLPGSWCRYFAFTVAASLVLAVVLFPSSHIAFAAAQTGIIVPLYQYPGEEWDRLIAIKLNNTSVPIVAVVNPDSGVGPTKNPEYVSAILDLKEAGIVVLGYVWTEYGARSSSEVRAEITKYKRWYSVDGIFFDAMSNLRGKLKYYNNLDDFVKGKGLTMTVGNPGTDTRRIYVGSVDNIVIRENSGLPTLSFLGGWHSDFDKSNFSFVSYDVESLDSSFVASASEHVAYMYITDDDLPNPYDSLPPYLEELAEAVGGSGV